MKFIKLSLILLSLGIALDLVAAQKCFKPHEQWLDCGESCYADDCKMREYFAPCESKCAPGCYCECGYYRDYKDNCVLEKDCPSFDNVGYAKICPTPKDPKDSCGKNEFYNDCGSYCGGTCKDYRVPSGSLACITLCKDGCFCVEGYLRHPVTGECVKSDKCPTTSEFDYINNVPIESNCPTEGKEGENESNTIDLKTFFQTIFSFFKKQ